MWGSPEEKERKLRIDVAAMAFAYEVENDPIASDEQFDKACLSVNLAQSTGNKKLDNYFRKHFQPHTGMWVHNHPDKEGLRRICKMKRQVLAMDNNLTINMRYDLAARIADDLDAHTAHIYDDGHRWHLGASQIGDACARKLWYGFRWVLTPDYVNAKGQNHKGRMMRLFNRGHKEEVRFVEWLRGMGFEVEEFAPSVRLYYDETSAVEYALTGDEVLFDFDTSHIDVTDDAEHRAKATAIGIDCSRCTPERTQFRIKDCNGHYGGSLDGMVTLPASYGALPKMLLEFKTAGEKAFNKLKEAGVRAAKPQHYAQMCSYGKRYELRYALYMCVNKNTDEIHIEIVELDWNLADSLTNKAEQIIQSSLPPAKLNENSAYFECKFCDFHAVCHRNKQYEKNCRSCKFSAPVENGEWACAYYGQIPRDFVAKGCDAWQEAR